jgi:hypothetical protein
MLLHIQKYNIDWFYITWELPGMKNDITDQPILNLLDLNTFVKQNLIHISVSWSHFCVSNQSTDLPSDRIAHVEKVYLFCINNLQLSSQVFAVLWQHLGNIIQIWFVNCECDFDLLCIHVYLFFSYQIQTAVWYGRQHQRMLNI